MTLRLRAALAAASLLLSVAPCRAQPAPVVDAPAGRAQGVTEGGVRAFKGLPYALPPVGARRWAPPAAAPRWEGVRDASSFGPACVQPLSHGQGLYSDDPPQMSEDCLSLNVWTPEHASGAPVMVWIHGGALRTGSSRESVYDGARLAARGIVVVSINYRLGVLGWLAHSSLSAASPEHVSGNQGLLDQIEALRWVKRNIAAYGGDPARVTVAGESAGGLSVLYLLASPPARGLFSQAIAESAYMISTPELKRPRFGAPSAEQSGEQLLAALKAPSLTSLRAMDAVTLTNAASAAGFAPFGAVDGRVLPAQLVDVFDRGGQAPVPVLAGFNSGEIRSLRALAPPAPASPAAYEAVIRARYGDLADAFLRLYPADHAAESVLATTRDALYGWTSERLVRSQTKQGEPSYLYLWDHGFPSADGAGLHAFHASEVPFVFGTLDRTPPQWPKAEPQGAQAAMSDAMLDYWASFVRNGAPRAGGHPDWPAYGPAEAFMDVRDRPEPSTHLMPGMFTLNEQVVCRRRAQGGQAWNWNVGLWAPPLPPARPECAPARAAEAGAAPAR